MRDDLESSVSQWSMKHGEFYGSGIASKFDAKKERQHDSYWNWASCTTASPLLQNNCR
jgi:3-oxoacyl-ACP reductase-like protein